MKNLWNSFWKWYNQNLTLNIAIAAILFSLQLIHLYWLFADVILFKLTGHSYFHLTGIWYYLIILVDYTEIPALITTSLIYINEIRTKGYSFKNVLFIFLLLSQFLHIFWITDEFVIGTFTGSQGQFIGIPAWLAWIAILIDYGEVPVIIDTFKKLFEALKTGDTKRVKEAFKE
jgi:hypothetical protein